MEVLLQINGDTAEVGVEPRQFKTGSSGYMGWGRATIDGKSYHVGITLVLAGSKPRKAYAKQE